MLEEDIGSVSIAENDRLVGLVSLGDLSDASQKQAGGALKEISEPAGVHASPA